MRGRTLATGSSTTAAGFRWERCGWWHSSHSEADGPQDWEVDLPEIVSTTLPFTLAAVQSNQVWGGHTRTARRRPADYYAFRDGRARGRSGTIGTSRMWLVSRGGGLSPRVIGRSRPPLRRKCSDRARPAGATIPRGVPRHAREIWRSCIRQGEDTYGEPGCRHRGRIHHPGEPPLSRYRDLERSRLETQRSPTEALETEQQLSGSRQHEAACPSFCQDTLDRLGVPGRVSVAAADRILIGGGFVPGPMCRWANSSGRSPDPFTGIRMPAADVLVQLMWSRPPVHHATRASRRMFFARAARRLERRSSQPTDARADPGSRFPNCWWRRSAEIPAPISVVGWRCRCTRRGGTRSRCPPAQRSPPRRRRVSESRAG